MDALNKEDLIRYLRQMSLKYNWKELFEHGVSAPAELKFCEDGVSFIEKDNRIEEENIAVTSSRSNLKSRRIITDSESDSDKDIRIVRDSSSSSALCCQHQENSQVNANEDISSHSKNILEDTCSSPESIIKIQPTTGKKSRRIICDSDEEFSEDGQSLSIPSTLDEGLCSPFGLAKKLGKPILVETSQPPLLQSVRTPPRPVRRVILSDSEEEGEGSVVHEKSSQSVQKRGATDSGDEALVDSSSDCSSSDDSWIVDDAEEVSVGSSASMSDWEDDEEKDSDQGSSLYKEDSDLEDANKENHSANNNRRCQIAAGKGISNSSSSKGLHSLRSPISLVPKTPSRTERNQQRVEALSTGLKSRRGRTYHHALAQDLFQIYNEVIFDSRLPSDLAVTWNKRLLTTAGYCRCRKITCTEGSGARRRVAAIELSDKVCDSEVRMRETLVHEMCHAATWLIDGLDRLDHGPAFRCWGRRATQCFPEIGEVKTTHSYGVHQPHQFQCSNASCGHVYGRHSRKGIDLVRQVCGKCKCSLQYLGVLKKDGSIAQPRGPTAFSGYMKTHFARKKAELLTEHIGSRDFGNAEVMRALAVEYKQRRRSGSQQHEQVMANSPLQRRHSGEDMLTAALVDLTI